MSADGTSRDIRPTAQGAECVESSRYTTHHIAAVATMRRPGVRGPGRQSAVTPAAANDSATARSAATRQRSSPWSSPYQAARRLSAPISGRAKIGSIRTARLADGRAATGAAIR